MKNNVTLKGCVVEKCIRISALFSAFRQVFGKDYYFGGETHDFWELVCVVEGAIGVTAGKDVFLLEAGQAVLHRPMEFHSFWSEKDSCPDIIVVTFTGDIMPAMKEWRFRPGKEEVEELCELLSCVPRIFQIDRKIYTQKIIAGKEAEAICLSAGLKISFFLRVQEEKRILPGFSLQERRITAGWSGCWRNMWRRG